MKIRDRAVGWMVTPLRLLPGNQWGRFCWWYWEKQGISREQQAGWIEEAEAQDAEERDGEQ